MGAGKSVQSSSRRTENRNLNPEVTLKMVTVNSLSQTPIQYRSYPYSSTKVKTSINQSTFPKHVSGSNGSMHMINGFSVARNGQAAVNVIPTWDNLPIRSQLSSSIRQSHANHPQPPPYAAMSQYTNRTSLISIPKTDLDLESLSPHLVFPNSEQALYECKLQQVSPKEEAIDSKIGPASRQPNSKNFIVASRGQNVDDPNGHYGKFQGFPNMEIYPMNFPPVTSIHSGNPTSSIPSYHQDPWVRHQQSQSREYYQYHHPIQRIFPEIPKSHYASLSSTYSDPVGFTWDSLPVPCAYLRLPWPPDKSYIRLMPTNQDSINMALNPTSGKLDNKDSKPCSVASTYIANLTTNHKIQVVESHFLIIKRMFVERIADFPSVYLLRYVFSPTSSYNQLSNYRILDDENQIHLLFLRSQNLFAASNTVGLGFSTSSAFVTNIQSKLAQSKGGSEEPDVCVFYFRLRLSDLPFSRQQLEFDWSQRRKEINCFAMAVVVVFDFRFSDLTSSALKPLPSTVSSWTPDHMRRLVHLTAQTHSILDSWLINNLEGRELTIIHLPPPSFASVVDAAIEKSRLQKFGISQHKTIIYKPPEISLKPYIPSKLVLSTDVSDLAIVPQPAPISPCERSEVATVRVEQTYREFEFPYRGSLNLCGYPLFEERNTKILDEDLGERKTKRKRKLVQRKKGNGKIRNRRKSVRREKVNEGSVSSSSSISTSTSILSPSSDVSVANKPLINHSDDEPDLPPPPLSKLKKHRMKKSKHVKSQMACNRELVAGKRVWDNMGNSLKTCSEFTCMGLTANSQSASISKGTVQQQEQSITPPRNIFGPFCGTCEVWDQLKNNETDNESNENRGNEPTNDLDQDLEKLGPGSLVWGSIMREKEMDYENDEKSVTTGSSSLHVIQPLSSEGLNIVSDQAMCSIQNPKTLKSKKNHAPLKATSKLRKTSETKKHQNDTEVGNSILGLGNSILGSEKNRKLRKKSNVPKTVNNPNVVKERQRECDEEETNRKMICQHDLGHLGSSEIGSKGIVVSDVNGDDCYKSVEDSGAENSLSQRSGLSDCSDDSQNTFSLESFTPQCDSEDHFIHKPNTSPESIHATSYNSEIKRNYQLPHKPSRKSLREILGFWEKWRDDSNDDDDIDLNNLEIEKTIKSKLHNKLLINDIYSSHTNSSQFSVPWLSDSTATLRHSEIAEYISSSDNRSKWLAPSKQNSGSFFDLFKI